MDTIDRLKILINLATSDGEMSPQERQYILSIGQANHLMVAEILPLFTAIDSTPKKFTLPADKKEDLLLEVVYLMRIDEKIYKAEMQFCAELAARLGYQEEVLFELMLQAKDLTPGDKESLRKVMKGYVK